MFSRSKAAAAAERSSHRGFYGRSKTPPTHIVTIAVQDGSTCGSTFCSPNMQEGISVLPQLHQDGRSSEHRLGRYIALESPHSLQNPHVDSSAAASASVALMNQNDAAVLIQAHFRGYMVRRTSPLSSLRVISSVKSELQKLRADTCTYESMLKLRGDPRERLKLSEKIMSLLLRLDSLQGVHPSVREIRRSVARELVDLQEALDLQLEHGDENTLEEVKESPSLDDSDFYHYQMVKIRITTWNLHI